MPFPHSEDIRAALVAANQAMGQAHTLLSQYDQLTETHENTIEAFRAERDQALVRVATLEAKALQDADALLGERQAREAAEGKVKGLEALLGQLQKAQEQVSIQDMVAKAVAEALAKQQAPARPG